MQYDPAILRRLQLVELSVLEEVDRVCRKHAIPYFLESGTALGAARHKGFIPWDDDVDLGMLRPDYERFLAVAGQELGDSFLLSDSFLDNRHAAMFAKVWKRGTKFYTQETVEAGIPQGVFVDVIPYDVLHCDERQARKQIRACRFWQNMAYLYHAKTITVPHAGLLGGLERVACRLAHAVVRAFASHEHIRTSFHAAAKAGVANPGERYMIMTLAGGEGVPKDVLVPPRPAMFEGKEFPGPADIGAYVSLTYGSDWHKLPSPEARKNHAPIELDIGNNGENPGF